MFRSGPISPGVVRALSLLVVMCTPHVALAAQMCEHPFAGGATCVRVFGTVSAVYALTASTYGVGALLIGKPRLKPRVFKAALFAVPVISWLAAMLGFTLGGMFGLLNYPHDASPFFFLDWFTFGVTFAATTIAVVIAYKKGLKS